MLAGGLAIVVVDVELRGKSRGGGGFIDNFVCGLHCPLARGSWHPMGGHVMPCARPASKVRYFYAEYAPARPLAFDADGISAGTVVRGGTAGSRRALRKMSTRPRHRPRLPLARTQCSLDGVHKRGSANGKHAIEIEMDGHSPHRIDRFERRCK
jgi:hypothetical protein